MLSDCGFNWHFPNDLDHLFMCLFAIGEIPIQILCLFLKISFLLLSFENSLYICTHIFDHIHDLQIVPLRWLFVFYFLKILFIFFREKGREGEKY